MNPKEFAMEYLFPHLGIDNPAWSSDVGGVSNGSYGLSLTLRGMVKLGQLYLQIGKSHLRAKIILLILSHHFLVIPYILQIKTGI